MGPSFSSQPPGPIQVLFQFVAEAAAKMAGFEMATLNAVRANGMEVVATAGPLNASSPLLGQVVPIDRVLYWIDNGEDWGRSRYVRTDSLPPEDNSWTWAPPLAPAGDGPEFWDAEHDMLLSCLYGADGALIGMLSLDCPIDGRIPDAEKRALLNLYVEQAELALGAALAAEAAEDRERRLAEMTALDNYRRQLVDTMTHELRSPLTAIQGHVEMLLDSGDLGSAGAEHVESIHRSSGRLAAIITDLLDLSRVSKLRSLPGDPVDLNEIARASVDQLVSTARLRAIALDLTLSKEPATVIGDSAELGLVISNLVGNALKYSPDGAHVVVSVSVEDGHAAGSVVLRCADNGIGISPADQERLFDEFYRSSDPQVRARTGTGLGLAVVQRVVTQHQGHLEVTSTLGQGATFEVRLPALSADLAAGANDVLAEEQVARQA